MKKKCLDLIKPFFLFLKKYLYIALFFCCCSNIFSQDFTLKELDKISNNNPDNLYTDIAAFSDGTLFYSIYNNIVENYGNFQKTHDFSNISNRVKFRSSNNIKTYNDSIVFFSTPDGIFSINTRTNSRKKLFNSELFNPKEPFNFSFTIDSDGELWVMNSDYNLLKIRNNKIIEKYKINTCHNIRTLYGNNFKIVKNSSQVYLNFRNEIFLIEKNIPISVKLYESDYTNYRKKEIIKSNLSKENRIFKRRDDFIGHLKSQVKRAIVTIDAERIYNLEEFNFFIKSKKITFLAFLYNELFFYSLIKDKDGYERLNLVHKEKINSKINRIAVSKNKIFICDKQNKIYQLKNNNTGFYKHSFYPISSLRGVVSDKNKNVYSILENQIGKVLKVDSSGKETTIFNNLTEKFEFPVIALYRLEIENDSLLWAYTQEFNIVKHNLYTNKTQFIKFPDKIAPFSRKYRGLMNSFVKLNDNEVLLFLKNTFYSFNKSDNSFSKYLTTNLKGIVANEMLRKDGIIWIGTRTNGLYYIDERTGDVTHYHPNSKTNKISSRFIFDLHFKANGDLMIGSADGLDILNISTGEVKNYSIKEGLPDNRVVTIEETKDSYWMGTFNGLLKMDKKTNNIFSFFTEHGLPDNEFNKVSSFKLNDNFLVFGGMNGFVKFDPSELKENTLKPKLRLINLKYFDYDKDSIVNKKYNLENITKLDVEYDKNFMTLNFTDGVNNDILYKIDNSDWLLSKKGEINVLGLQDGEHTLNVKSKGSSENELEYKIFVSKVFYKKNWVQLLSFFMLSLFIFLIIAVKSQQNRLRRIKKSKIRQLEDVALRGQMNPHFLFNCINNIQSVFLLEGEISVNKYFNHLSDVLRFTIDNTGKNRISLENEIKYLKAYVNLEHLREGGSFKFKFLIDNNLKYRNILIPPLLFQPLIENAIQHGLMPKEKDRLLKVNFILEGKYLKGEIIDNGIGLKSSKDLSSKKKYKSYGNSILKKRINIYNDFKSDYIQFEMKENKETSGVTSSLRILISSEE